MGFNKKIINMEGSIRSLNLNELDRYYRSADALFFEDELSFKIFKMFCDGKDCDYIKSKINQTKNVEV